MDKKIIEECKKTQKTTQSSWVELVYSSIISIFFIDDNLDGAFLDVGPSSDSDVLTPNKNERMCSEYGDYVIPFYGCTFSVMGICLSFSVFDIYVFKHLVMTPSQLYPSS